MICPQKLFSPPVDLCLWLLYGVSPSHIWSSSYFLSITVLSKGPCLLTMCLKQDCFSSVMFACNVSGKICCRACFFIFLVFRGIHRALLQHHISRNLKFSQAEGNLKFLVTGDQRISLKYKHISSLLKNLQFLYLFRMKLKLLSPTRPFPSWHSNHFSVLCAFGVFANL